MYRVYFNNKNLPNKIIKNVLKFPLTFINVI